MLKKKERPLCKPRASKETFIFLAFIFIWLIIFLVLIFFIYRSQSTISLIIVFAWLFLPPLLVAGYFLEKKEKKKKGTILISLMEFINRSINLRHLSKIHIRAIRHVLGFIFDMNPAIIYPDDPMDKWIRLSRASRIPYAFELVLGTANRLSIPLAEQEVDSMIDIICGIKRGGTVEEFIIAFSEELGKKSVSSDRCIFKLKLTDREHKGKTLMRSIPGGLFFGVLFWIGWVLGNNKSFAQVSSVVVFLLSITIGSLLVWYLNLSEIKSIRHRLEKTDSSWSLIEQLAVPVFVQKYLQNTMSALLPGQVLIIRESEPMPVYSESGLEKMPLFCELCSNLKILADLEDRFYIEPVNAILSFFKEDSEGQKKEYNANVTICDGIENAYISFSLADSNPVEKHNL